MQFVAPILFGFILPAVATGGVLVFGRAMAAKEDGASTASGTGISSGWHIAVALGVGYIVGYIGLEGVPPFPPRTGIHYLCYLAVLGGILGCLWHLSLWGRVCLQIVLSIVIPRLLLTAIFKHTWGTLEGILWWVCLAGAIFLFWSLVERSFRALPPGASGPFVYFGVFGGTALILALSGSLRLAQHGGILVALFAVGWILTLVLQPDRQQFVFPASAAPVMTLLLIGCYMNGYFFAEVPAVSAILLGIAPALAQVGWIAGIQKLGDRRAMLVQVAAIAFPVLIAIGVALARSGLFGDSSGY